LAKQQGITDEHLAQLEARPLGLFTKQEIAAIDLAEAMWTNAGEAGKNQELMRRLHAEFSDAQLVELCWAMCTALAGSKMVAFFGLERER
jgi:alkylhydroperoxidase family enzyme